MDSQSLLSIIILGVVEGITEFLPVSSTGHLILAGELLGYDPERWKVFNIVIQLGAILAIVVLYWRTLWAVAQGLLRRDPRMKERKKSGQPGARKRFQFSKR